jgi:hypothetical protein
LTWRVRSSLPMPSLSMPALLLAKVSPVTPDRAPRRSGVRECRKGQSPTGNQQAIAQQAVQRGLGRG